MSRYELDCDLPTLGTARGDNVVETPGAPFDVRWPEPERETTAVAKAPHIGVSRQQFKLGVAR